MSKLFSAFLILVALSSLAFSQQTQPCGASKDVRFVKDKPTVYLKFERYGKALDPMEQRLFDVSKTSQSTEKGKDIWLRLHNNTCWSISFPTYSFYMKRVPSADDPKKVKVSLGEVENNAEVNVLYRIEEDNGKQVIFGGHSYSISRLPPGESIVFSVHREHLSKQRMIYVNFNYEWEDGIYSNNIAPVHRSEYYTYRLELDESK